MIRIKAALQVIQIQTASQVVRIKPESQVKLDTDGVTSYSITDSVTSAKKHTL